MSLYENHVPVWFDVGLVGRRLHFIQGDIPRLAHRLGTLQFTGDVIIVDFTMVVSCLFYIVLLYFLLLLVFCFFGPPLTYTFFLSLSLSINQFVRIVMYIF